MEGNKTKRNRSTRMKIGSTLLQLLERYELSDISISQITKTANVSRMTFYHYFETKEAALTDYLSEIILLYLAEIRTQKINDKPHTLEHLEFTLQFFSRYEHFMLLLEKKGCYHILIQGVNQFLDTYYRDHFENKLYHLYFYAGALLNVFLEWLKRGKKESADEIAKLLLSYTTV